MAALLSNTKMTVATVAAARTGVIITVIAVAATALSGTLPAGCPPTEATPAAHQKEPPEPPAAGEATNRPVPPKTVRVPPEGQPATHKENQQTGHVACAYARDLPAPQRAPTRQAAPAPEAVPDTPSSVTEYVRLAKTDSLALLQLAKAKYDASVHDYTATFVRQERDNKGRLAPAETMFCKFRRAPFNVFLHWRKGARRIDKALYAPAFLGPDILVHPTGLAGLIAPVVRIDLEGKHAESAQQIKNFGFGTALDRLVQRGLLARRQNELNTTFLGETVVGGRPSIAMEWRLPPGRNHQYGRIVIHLCQQTLLPLTIGLWDWDERLQAKYVYGDLNVNANLTDDDFSRKACGLGG